jgi:hypothetical protein
VQQVVIENPILNSPFEAPRRCFKLSDEGDRLSRTPAQGQKESRHGR